MKLEFYGQFLKKFSNIKFHENPSSGSPIVSCGQIDRWTDMTQLIVASRNFVNAPEKTLGHVEHVTLYND